MSLSAVTPVILTFNEEVNVGRTLESLKEFPRVVVVDSGSKDRTEEIARSFPNVTWFVRPFDDHARQWRWALEETGTATPFILALDADMSVSPALIAEIEGAVRREDLDGAVIGIQYRISGIALVGSLYPPELRFLRRSRAEVADAGHTQKFRVAGRVVKFEAHLVHDDRKPLERFVGAQLRYSAAELPRLLSGGPATQSLKSRLRRSFPLTPLLVWMLAWVRAGGPFGGAAARRYGLERLIYESILRWRVEDAKLTGAGREHGPALERGETREGRNG